MIHDAPTLSSRVQDRAIDTNAKTNVSMIVLTSVLVFGSTLSASTLTHNLGATATLDNAGSPDITISELTDSPPNYAMTGANADVAFSLSGSLSSDFVGLDDSYQITVTSWRNTNFDSATSTVSGGTNLEQIAVRSSYGWGEAGAGGQLDEAQAIAFTFDLSNLPANTFLRLTEATGRQWVNHAADTVSEMQVIINGRSHSSATIVEASRDNIFTVGDLDFDIYDGDVLWFRGAQDAGMFAQSFTITAIPEAGHSGLIASVLALGFVISRRRIV